ncbi:MAG: HlyD family secretion protein [Bacteroidales bacterium]|nr:HlyD family secretion protein [Bacteroidales bacterium]
MKWNPRKNSRKPEEEVEDKRRSEEINEIIERMPMTFGRWVAVAFFIFTALLLLFGWIIKYPDTVTGQIKINSSHAPVKLVANTSGNIHEILFAPQQEVSQGEYIAVVDNPAVTTDVQAVIGLIGAFDPNEKRVSESRVVFPERVSLGDLNLKYYSFLTSLKNKTDHEKDNIYEKQRKSLLDDIGWKQSILSESQKLLSIAEEKLEISRKWFDKYASLSKDEIVTYEYEVDRSKSDLLSARQEEQNLKKELASIRMQIMENENRLNQLQIEQRERERQLQLDLLTTYHDLNDNLKAWEQKYVFKAPFSGKVEYLKFLTENQFVQAGEEIFGVVPKESNIFGQMLLPSVGAGKVKVGSRVTVKLDNYPYMEYGSIEGKVASISLLTQPQNTGQSSIDTYLLLVELPDQLKTNYGEILDFQHEIGGYADIIVKERRLIQRLFDNLKYRTKDK